ncbi:hypothetical protein F5Y12DRAFT_770772 [Xylaria sp. FL1777]|nr:hypothetical protein F5Y12DRAFT_770772 [Xylaria sp. FL1777]
MSRGASARARHHPTLVSLISLALLEQQHLLVIPLHRSWPTRYPLPPTGGRTSTAVQTPIDSIRNGALGAPRGPMEATLENRGTEMNAWSGRVEATGANFFSLYFLLHLFGVRASGLLSADIEIGMGFGMRRIERC